MSKLFCMSAMWMITLFAAGIDLSQYEKSETEKTPVPPVINPSFEEGAKGWKLKGKAKVERGFGTVASGGLLLERSNPEEYQLSSQSLRLKPGRIYNFSIMIRSEDVKGSNDAGDSLGKSRRQKTGNRKVYRGGAFLLRLRLPL